MSLLFLKVNTALDLGLPNLLRVLTYRLGIKLGLHPVRRLRARASLPPFFEQPATLVQGFEPNSAWSNQGSLFGWIKVPIGENPPDWHANPLNHQCVKNPERAWWCISDFDPEVGDIKTVWETSRFDWVLAFAQSAAQGDETALQRLNTWLADWCVHNPYYCGPNWKCGQEVSIRVMHLAMAAVILGQECQPLPSLLDLIEAHLQRIAPTLFYAVAQDNNHGTSEAAALWMGGSWLAQQGREQGHRWEELGRKWLENRVKRLIQEDGSFSQYSLNYHRLLLDTLSMVEVWRQKLGLPRFSTVWYEHACAATHWLLALVDAKTGDGPNLGANDGARLLPLTNTDYRDYRPSVQLASVLFNQRCVYSTDGSWNLPLAWLGFTVPDATVLPPGSELFDYGGYALLHRKRVMCLLRYPRFQFRPSHADALHVDLWIDGTNHLRDSGSFSYNTDLQWLNYFPGTISHNTVQFDSRDQMPRLGRFLFGNWLKTKECDSLLETQETVSFGAGYQDSWQAQHHRRVTLSDRSLLIRDSIAGFKHKAVLRWRLKPGLWRLEDQIVTDGIGRLTISGSMSFKRLELVEGWESRYYLQKTVLPVLEAEVNEAGILETTYCW